MTAVMVDVETRIVRRERYDIAALIVKHRDEYLAVDLKGGYQEWERPKLFLYNWVEFMEGDVDDVDFHWTEQKYADLTAVCPEALVDDVEDPGVPCPACPGGRKIHDPGCMLEDSPWVTDGMGKRP